MYTFGKTENGLHFTTTTLSMKMTLLLARGILTSSILIALSFIQVAEAQDIDTFAGNGIAGFSGDGGPATSSVVVAALRAASSVLRTDSRSFLL